MIRIVTDSAAMLPADLRDRYDIAVVPMTITIDGVEFAEGDGIGTDEFYARLANGADVSTSAPSPGALGDAYGRVARSGATGVLSIHTGSRYSATVASATIAAGLADIDVTVVDTDLASFPVALCVWAAGDHLAANGTLDQAEAIARGTATRTGSVFVVGVPELARHGGRFTTVDGDLTPTTVLELAANELREHQRVPDADTALEVMTEHTRQLARQEPIRVGVGHAQRPSMAAHIADRLIDEPGIVDVTTYEVGPSVGAHTGAGTVGVVYAPVEPRRGS